MLEDAAKEAIHGLRGILDDNKFAASVLAATQALDSIRDANLGHGVDAFSRTMGTIGGLDLDNAATNIAKAAGETAATMRVTQGLIRAAQGLVYVTTAGQIIGIPLALLNTRNQYNEANARVRLADSHVLQAQMGFEDRHLGSTHARRACLLLELCAFFARQIKEQVMQCRLTVTVKTLVVGAYTNDLPSIQGLAEEADQRVRDLFISLTTPSYDTLQQAADAAAEYASNHEFQDTLYIFLLVGTRDSTPTTETIHQVHFPLGLGPDDVFIVGLGGRANSNLHAISENATFQLSGGKKYVHDQIRDDHLRGVSIRKSGSLLPEPFRWPTAGALTGATAQWATLSFALPKTAAAVLLVGPGLGFGILGGAAVYGGKKGVEWYLGRRQDREE